MVPHGEVPEHEPADGCDDAIKLVNRTTSEAQAPEHDLCSPADDTDAPKQSDPSSSITHAESTREVQERRVLRKIDRWLMPIMCLVYTLQYIDKSAMSYAAVYTFRTDRDLEPGQYSWLGTLFYLGYTLFEFPGVWILQKTRTNVSIGILVIIWGGLVMAMAGPKGFAGLATVRTLLGAAESLVTPGFALITARFYRRREQPFRLGIWYCFNGVGSMVGGLMGYGSGHIDIPDLPRWAWIFILNGCITILAGFVFLAICPNSPGTARFLSPDERIIALERIKDNQSSIESRTIKWHQVREALNPFEDPQGWLLFLSTFSLTVPNGGLGNYLHLILQAYGYNAFGAILLGIPAGAVQVLVVLTSTFVAMRFRNMRIYIGICGIAMSLTGMVIQYTTHHNGSRLFGYYIIVGFVGALAQLFIMPASNVTGYSKRVTVQGMVFAAYGSGNALGPRFWRPHQTPPYRDGMLTCIVCFCCCIILMLVLRLYYVKENARRDRMLPSEGPIEGARDPFADTTDVENVAFRYQM